MELPEIEGNVAIASIILWLVVVLALWAIPSFGKTDFSLPVKILITVIALPMAYFLVNAIDKK
ncbi:MAG: hypothetical protein JSW08_00425 [archaeon]|nr:MAG: hypothetical protein JSW08_00425 [archaeon]